MAAEDSAGALADQPATASKERHYRIHFGAIGYSYETIFGDYLVGAEEITVVTPFTEK